MGGRTQEQAARQQGEALKKRPPIAGRPFVGAVRVRAQKLYLAVNCTCVPGSAWMEPLP
jgi:hypothetical protein